MEKNLSLDDASTLPESRERRELASGMPISLPADKDLPEGKPKINQSCFVVRLSQDERKVIEELSRDFDESFITIFTRAVHLYRAIAEAAGEGGSLVMLIKTGHLSSRGGLPPLAKEVLPIRRERLCSTNFGVIPEKYGSNTATTKENRNLSTHNDVQELIIAVRDQFADSTLTPIALNSLYIPKPKGWKTEKLSLKAEGGFAEKLENLVRKTGFKKSTIIRDSILLYNFVKRRFREEGTTFYIGGSPIVTI